MALTDESLDDALDRRAALQAAVALILEHGGGSDRLLAEANFCYAWLRRRDTLRAFYVFITPLTHGTSFTKGNTPMDTTYSGDNSADLTFTLSGVDSRNSQVPVPSDTWTWSLADPDSSGAVLNVAGDTLSAVVTPGGATPNLVLSVAGLNTGDQAQCAISLVAGAAVGVEIVPPAPAP